MVKACWVLYEIVSIFFAHVMLNIISPEHDDYRFNKASVNLPQSHFIKGKQSHNLENDAGIMQSIATEEKLFKPM